MSTTANTTDHGYVTAYAAGGSVRHIVQVTGDYYGAYAAAAVCGVSPRIRWSNTRWTGESEAYPTPAAAAESSHLVCKRCAAAAHKMTATESTPAPAESLEENTMNTPAPAAVTRETHDIEAAWKFITDSYDGTFSPSRRDWTDADIFAFVAEYHVQGLEAVKRAPAPANIHPRALELLAVSDYPDGARVILDPATAPTAEYGTARAVVTAYFQGGPGRGECVDAVILTVTGGDSHPARNFAALDALQALQGRVSGNITAGQYQTLVDPDSYAGTVFVYGTWSD